ncbi:STAS domain-containing protein [Pseudomonas sp. PDM16]|uniref:STAS domain-containing protein n=1 Tax=Pseudomonas sp. PDM16 TaxID=2769292 RepID=UPI0017840359|nr:STAS domain-containing protein [Pseudomonas sp. PDM16]MBD9414973.1 STAS domain-containing protein [Pseudomonas sp. PDM16]
MFDLSQPAPARLRLGGSLTIYEVAEVRDALLAAFAGGRDETWQLELTALEELDSAGAQLLLAAHRHLRAAGGDLRLAEPAEPVRELLVLLHLNDLLPTGEDHVR